jgi:CAAX prenyl protease-like protein
VTAAVPIAPCRLAPLPWVAPFAVFAGLMAVVGLVQQAGVDARTWYAVRAGATLLALVGALFACAELRRAPGRAALADAVGVGIAVLGAWLVLDQSWATLGTLAPSPFAAADTQRWQVAARLVGAVLVAPLAEELFFRGFLMRWLVRAPVTAVDPRSVPLRAVLIQAALFATVHAMIVAGFVAGLAYGWLYRRTGSLWACVVAHATTNGLLAAWVLSQGAWHLW